MKCKAFGCWNRIEVKKLFIEQETNDPEVKALIPYYEPLKVEICKKCKSVIAEPKELIRIIKIKHYKFLRIIGYLDSVEDSSINHKN